MTASGRGAAERDPDHGPRESPAFVVERASRRRQSRNARKARRRLGSAAGQNSGLSSSFGGDRSCSCGVSGGGLAAAGTLRGEKGGRAGVCGDRALGEGVDGWDGKPQTPPPFGPQRSIAPDGGAVTERSEGKGACDLDSPAAGATMQSTSKGGGRPGRADSFAAPRALSVGSVRLATRSRALRIASYAGIAGYGGAPVTPRWRGEPKILQTAPVAESPLPRRAGVGEVVEQMRDVT